MGWMPGAVGGIGEKEVEQKSAKAEESAGVAALEPLSKKAATEGAATEGTSAPQAGETWACSSGMGCSYF